MTIAAGLICKEGVLLCADTEESDWASKSHASKIRYFEFPRGKIAFAYAGNTRAAHSAVLKCERALTGSSGRKKTTEPLAEIEKILDREYRRNVLTHPDYEDLHYWLLIALWSENGTKLFITERTEIDEVVEFECKGIGEPLARHLIKSGASKEMPYQKALPLAAYALALVKGQMTRCGGMSVFVMLGNDGKIATVTSLHDGPCVQVERYAKGYDFIARRLLMDIADPAADPRYFEDNLEATFITDARRMFSEMLADRRRREKGVADLNSRLKANQVKKLVLQLSLGIEPDLSH
jgi:hypothetical protein